MQPISRSFQASAPLRDGRLVHVRPIRPSDREVLLQEFHKLSPESVRNRFFNVKRDLTPAELDYFTEVDLWHHVALVAEIDNDGARLAAGVGRFVSKDDQPGHSEMAITIADELQGNGIGKILLQQLIVCARQLRVGHLDATVFAENTRMASLLRHTGLPVTSKTADGIRSLSIAL